MEFGVVGTRLYSLFWLITTVGYVVAVIAHFTGQSWAIPVLVITTLLSVVITALDWNNAFRGTLIDVVILAVLLFGPQTSTRLYRK